MKLETSSRIGGGSEEEVVVLAAAMKLARSSCKVCSRKSKEGQRVGYTLVVASVAAPRRILNSCASGFGGGGGKPTSPKCEDAVSGAY